MEGYNWKDIAISWAPMALFIVVWIYGLRHWNKFGPYANLAKSAEFAERQAKALERIADVLERRA